MLAFIGKEFTGVLDEILIHLLNCQYNLIKGYTKLISSQSSQMRITIKKLGNSKKHPISLDAAKYLNIGAYDKFHKSYLNQNYYHLSIQLDGSIQISRDKLLEQLRKFSDKNDRCSYIKDIPGNVFMTLFCSINLSQNIF